MRPATMLLVEKYELFKLKYDFMGYEFEKLKDLSFHHLLIPKCSAPEMGLERGYYYWNGVILSKNVAHQYLHVIEEYNLDMFFDITSEMLDERMKGYIDMDNIKRINDILNCFEREYANYERHGQPIIKDKYYQRVLKKNF